MTVGVNSVSYDILGRGDGHSVKDIDLRSQVEVAKFSPRWRLLIIAQIVNKCLLSGQGLFTCWPMIVYLLVKACLLVGQGLFTYGQCLFTSWPRIVYFLVKA